MTLIVTLIIHALIRLRENGKGSLDQKNFVGAVLMDLSKAFDSKTHDLSIAKIHAYGFAIDVILLFYWFTVVLQLLYLYLKRINKNVRINNFIMIFGTTSDLIRAIHERFYNLC